MAFFERVDGQTYLGTRHTAGPWDSQFMHAGAPTALAGHIMSGLPSLPRSGFLGRLTLEILRPIPVGPLQIRTTIDRPGKKIALVSAQLLVDEQRVALARAWWIRSVEGLLDSVAPTQSRYEDAPHSGELIQRPAGWLPGYLDAIEWSSVTGQFAAPGPACVWAQPKMDLVGGCELQPIEAAWLIADSASGISAEAHPQDLTFVNTELTVHLVRPPTTTRIWMDAHTQVDPRGVGVAESRLGDASGSIGGTGQLLFVEPR